MFKQSLEEHLQTRQRALTPRRVLRDVDFSDEVRGVREIANMCIILNGLFAEMALDGIDQSTKVGVQLVRIRSCIDTLESRIYVNDQGEWE